ncbi:MAG TPA: nuclear transport factor 2 family protein [Thermoanaerobaculia bacterium]|nr:nuclear transport factor 2 family protein [Thermoanaerobaculia bacterium]
MSDNVQIVQGGYNDFLTGNVEGVLNRFADDFTFTVPGAPEIPYAGTKRTREELASFFRDLGTMVTFSAFEPREYVASGDRVIAIGRYAGKVNQSGHPFDGDWAMAWRIQDGKVVEFTEYSDATEIRRGFAG